MVPRRRHGVLIAGLMLGVLAQPSPSAVAAKAPKLPVLPAGAHTIGGPAGFVVTVADLASKDVLWQIEEDVAIHVCLTYVAVGSSFDVGFETKGGSEVYSGQGTSGPVRSICHDFVEAILFKCYGGGETCAISWRVDQMETLLP